MPITQISNPTQVNTTAGQNELLIQVYDLADGSHIAFYAQNATLGSVEAATALIGRRLDSNGVPTGSEIVLSLPSIPAGFTPDYVDVIVQSDGTFVAMREVSNGGLNMNSHVLFQHYNADGSANGSTVTYGSTQNGNYTATYEFVANPAGGFAVLAEIINQSGPVQSIVTFSSSIVQTSSAVQPANYYAPFYLRSGDMVRISEAFDGTVEVLFPGTANPTVIPVNGAIDDGIYREGPSGSIYIFGDYGDELAVYRVNSNGTFLKVATIPTLSTVNVNRDLAVVDLLVRPDGSLVVAYSIIENGVLDCAIRQFSSAGVADGPEVRLGFAGGIDGAPFLFNNANGSFSVVYSATTGANDADTEVFTQAFNASSAPLTLTGTTGNDTLNGSDGDDTINGLAGNDVISAGNGNDFINPGDNVGGTTGFDTIRTGAGSDTVSFIDSVSGFFDLIYDYASSITVTINGANGTVVEGGGMGTDTLQHLDRIDGSLGGLFIGGTNGVDTFNVSLSDASDFVVIRGGRGVDVINNTGVGFVRADYANATRAVVIDLSLASGQVINDGHGNTETLVGVSEVRGSVLDDSFTGSNGDDRFILDGGNDTVNGGAGFDRVRYDRNGYTNISVDLQAGFATGLWNGAAFRHSLTSIEFIRGSFGDDTIRGSAANERFESRGGNDLFVYIGGQDVISDFAGGSGASDRIDVSEMSVSSFAQLQSLMTQAGANTVITFSGGNTLTLNNVTIGNLAADDFVFATAGATVLNGTAGDDTLTGTSGDDIINGFAGNDTINAGAGNDTINPGDNIGGLTGFEDIRTGAGNDTVSFASANTGFFNLIYDYATSGIAATINGASGSVVENGGIGTDSLTGLDRIDGNIGGLSITGSAAADTFNITLSDPTDFLQIRPYGGNDTITNNGPGFVRVDYRGATGGIVVDLTRSTGQIINDGNGGTDTLIGAIYEIAGSFQADTITGNAGDNSFILNGGNDVLNGGGGFDRLRYDRNGVNNLNVNLTTGIITGTWNNVAFNHTVSSIEHVRGSMSNDTVIGSIASERFEGRGGNDAFIYNGGDDVITDFDGGGQAQPGDTLDVRAMGISSWGQMQGLMRQTGSNVSITFSPGNTVTLNNTTIANLFADDFILTFAGSGITVNGTSGDDVLFGAPGNDTLNGFAGSDILNGEAGDDIINPGDNAGGFAGYDTIHSGIGNDTITFIDAVTGFFDLRYDHASSGIAVTINGATGQVVELRGLGTDTLQNLDRIDGNVGGLAIFGTTADDSYNITLSDVTDFFSARPGGGNDLINWGGIGLLRLDYRSAPTGIGVDLAAATNQIYNDGYGGVDTIQNYRAGIEVMGSAWADTFNGSSNDDRFVLLGGNDSVNGGAGFDRVRYDRPEYMSLVVNLANNTASGYYNGAPFTHSLVSIEWIRGSLGNDMITGSTRDERFDGRGGNDTFVYNGGQDRISDFVSGTGATDEIDLWAMGVGNLRQALLIATQVGADTVFTFSGGATLTLNNLQLASLVADDIVTYVNTVQGTGSAESLAGTAGMDEIFGLGGNDTLDGRGGGDVVDGGEGDDLIYYYGSDTAANIRGGNGTDTLLVLGGSAPTGFNLAAQGFEGARMELADNTSTITWSTISYVYNSSWQSLTTNQVNDDGTRISTQYDRGNLAWSQIVEEYDAAGNRVIQRTFGDDNTYQFFYWDPNGAQQWNNFSETFNLNGERLLQRIYNDGGTYRFFYWDPTQGQNWTNFDEEFDAAGGRHTQRIVYDDGSTRNFYWDVNASFNWTTFDEEYTTGPNATRSIQRINYDDGTSSQQFWDTNNSQSYSTYVDYMNAAGQRIEQRIFHDQGVNSGGYTRYFYDPANLEPWSSRTDVYNAAGILISSSQVPG